MKFLTNLTFSLVSALSLGAIPAYSSTLLQFTTTTSGGTVTLDGGAGYNNDVSAINRVLFNRFSINLGSQVAITQTGGTDGLTMSGTKMNPILSLYGGVASYGIADGTLLLQISLLSALTNLNGSSTLNVGITSANAVASITGDQTFLDKIFGFAVGTPVTVTGTINGTGGGISGGAWTANNPVTATSEQFGINLTATPEPVSLLLAGMGLLATGLCLRRKSNPSS